MPLSSQYYQLSLYHATNDASEKFIDFRTALAGDASSSNMNKIDLALHNQAVDIAALKLTRGLIYVAASYVSANYYEASASDITEYTANLGIVLTLNETSLGTVTLNINSLGTKTLMKYNDNGVLVNLASGDLKANQQNIFRYNGTVFVWVNPGNNEILPQVAGGRLTLSTGVAVTTSDVTLAGTLYYTPYLHNKISLWQTGGWFTKSFSELSLNLSACVANKNYDIFIFDSSGTLTLEAVAWTNDTTRASTLALQDGIYVRGGLLYKRYIGTIRTTGTAGQCEDSVSKRYVWNFYNQVERNQLLNENTSHTYASTWRDWNGAVYSLNYVQGFPQVVKVSARVNLYCSATTGQAMAAIVTNTDSGFAAGTATIGSTVATASSWINLALTYQGTLGYGYVYPREYVNGGITGTFTQFIMYASQMM